MRALAAVLLLALLLPVAPPEAAAQERPDASGQVVTLGVNAVLSGLAAGAVQKLRGGSFRDGLARGALGGGIAYLGKRVAVQRFDGAGLAGRQVAAVGSSIVGNAAAGRGTLEQLVLPVGFARLYLDASDGIRARARIDLHSLLWTAYAAVTPELRFDAAASLSAGAPVFRSPGYVLGWDETGDEVAGFTPAGVILLSDLSGPGDLGERMSPVIFAHERIHVIQYDQLFAAGSAPLQEWVLPRVAGGGWIGRYLDLDLVSPAVYGVSIWYRGAERLPWEREAHFLAGQ